MAVLKRDANRHTYADYLTWSRTYGDELVDGAAYIREPPSPSARHQLIVGELCRQAVNALKGSTRRAPKRRERTQRWAPWASYAGNPLPESRTNRARDQNGANEPNVSLVKFVKI